MPKEALKIVNRALTISMSKHDLYKYGWQKYRILYKMGKTKDAANYLLYLSTQLSKTSSDRAIFFAAIVFGEMKNYKKAEIEEKIMKMLNLMFLKRLNINLLD